MKRPGDAREAGVPLPGPHPSGAAGRHEAGGGLERRFGFGLLGVKREKGDAAARRREHLAAGVGVLLVLLESCFNILYGFVCLLAGWWVVVAGLGCKRGGRGGGNGIWLKIWGCLS